MPVHPGEIEQVADEALEPARFEEDRASRVVGREGPLAEPLGITANRRQRRLQLVADREQEVPLALTGRGKLVGHLVERLRQRGELSRTLLGDPARRLSCRKRVARLGHPPHRPDDRTRDPEREHRGKDRPRKAGKEQIAEERPPGCSLHARRAQQQEPAVRDRPVGVDVALPVDRHAPVARAVHVLDIGRKRRPKVDDLSHPPDHLVGVRVAHRLPPGGGLIVREPRQRDHLRMVDLLAREDRTDPDRQSQGQRQRGQRRRKEPAPKRLQVATAL